MNQQELDNIIKLHKKWLAGESDGVRANLSSTTLSNADLSGANLDYACWPLCCGSLQVKGDKQLIGQLLYHALDLAKHSGVDVGLCDRIRELANNSNPVIKHKKEKV